MEVVLHKIAAGLCAAFLLREQHHFVIRQEDGKSYNVRIPCTSGTVSISKAKIVFMAVPCIQNRLAPIVSLKADKKRQPHRIAQYLKSRFTLHKQYRLSPAALPA